MCQYNEEVERDEWKRDTAEGPLRRDTATTGKGGGTSVAVEGRCQREGHLRMEGRLQMEGPYLVPTLFEFYTQPLPSRYVAAGQNSLSKNLRGGYLELDASPTLHSNDQTQRRRGLARRMSILVAGKSLTMSIRWSSPTPILLEPPQTKWVLRQQYRVLAGAKHRDCKGKNKTKGGGYDTQIYTHQVPFNEPFLESSSGVASVQFSVDACRIDRMFPCGAPGFARDFIGIHGSTRMYIRLNWFTLIYIGVHRCTPGKVQ
ncbi:hypothetical protein ARMGADRAFT_1022496 [Armillaria gallica]|uniref:Uncharacterized protein n=1 Tax=Armillaria gallica TaxID=47427 RepID=A0A2H3E958_ARMGA|nr:hypothetical protein ARMGADRAFT_1022496 [Armillaria gallica]